MTTDYPSLIGDAELANELSGARRHLDSLLADVRGFATLHHEQPWIHLDHLLGDLRAAATTVAALEDLAAKLG